MSRITLENNRLEEENRNLIESNERYQHIINVSNSTKSHFNILFLQDNQSFGVQKELFINDLGTQITGLDQIYHSYDNHEQKYDKKTSQYKRDLYDLIEYVKWITSETSFLRKRIRAAEAVICQLRTSGE